MKQKLLLTLLCLVFAMNGKAWAQTSVDGEIEWSFNAENGTLLIAGNGAMKDYSNHSSGTYGMAPWLIYATQIKSITIGEGVTRIGNYAFYDCSVLESVTFNPGSLTYIGSGAFCACEQLKSIIIPNTVEEVGSEVFAYCSSLGYIQLSENLKSLPSGMLLSCTSLKELIIPNSVVEVTGGSGVSYSAFTGAAIETITFGSSSMITGNPSRGMGLSSLTKVITNSQYIVDNFSDIFSDRNYPLLTEIIIGDSVRSIAVDAFENATQLKNITISNGVETIGDNAFYGCSGILTIEIPNSVKTIGDYAFCYCSSLARITLGESVVSIGEYAFSGTRWDNNRPDGEIYLGKALLGYRGDMDANMTLYVKEGTMCIASNALWGFTELDSVHIPNSVISIGKKAFYQSGLKYIKLPDSLQEINDYTFAECEIGSIELPQTITRIGENAFEGCTLASINIPKSVKVIGEYAFSGNLLTNIDIPESVEELAGNAFWGCPLNTIKVNSDYAAEKVKEIQEYDLYGTYALENVIFGDNVTTIVPSIMENNKVVKSVMFGTNVKDIGDFSFCGCKSLSEIILLTKEIPSAGMDCFLNVAKDCKIYVTDVEAYREAWPEYAHMIVDIGGLVEFEEQVFTYTGHAPELTYTSKVPVNVVFEGLMTDAGTYEAEGKALFALGSDTVEKAVDCIYTITKAPLYVVAADTSRVYGEENPEFQISLYGFVNGEDSTVLTSFPTAYSDAFVESNVGEYTIYTVGGEAKNYEFVHHTAVLTVEKAEQTINWELESDTVVIGTQLELNALATSGLQVTYAQYDAFDETISELKGLYMDGGKFYLDCRELGVLQILAVQDGMMGDYENYQMAYTIKRLVVVEPERYALTFLIDDEVYCTDSLAEGATIILPETPVKEGHTFGGWGEVPETMPAEEVTISGFFTVNIYKVYYYVGDVLIHTAEVPYGEAIPEYVYEPTAEGDVFVGWVGETYETMPAHDVTYKAEMKIADGIEVLGDDGSQWVVYDLMGQKVLVDDVRELSKGLYIINGRKVLIKE